MTTSLADRIASVRARIDAAVARRGPGPDVTLCAVSKRHPAAAIAEAYALGLRDFGENYAQELRDKRAELAHLDGLRWHAIGPVQSNKAKYVVGTALIHTVDRIAILEPLARRAAAKAIVQPVLVEVDLAGEASKSGVRAEDLPALLDAFADTPALRCEGLMAIPPIGTPDATRPYFAALRRLADTERARPRPNVELRELSMGMSADFEVAIAEGATIVRVGTAVFGPRPG